VHHKGILCWHNLQRIPTAHLVQPFSTHSRGVLPLPVCTTNAYCAGTTCSAFQQQLGPAIQHTLERCTSSGCVHHKCILCWHNLQRIPTARLVQPISTHWRGVFPLAVCTTKVYCAGATCSAFPQHTWSSHSALTQEVYFHWLCAPQRHTVLAQPAAHSNSSLVQPFSTHWRGVLPLAVCTTNAYCAGTTCSAFQQHTWSSQSAHTLKRWASIDLSAIALVCSLSHVCQQSMRSIRTGATSWVMVNLITCTSACFAGTFLQLGDCEVTGQKEGCSTQDNRAPVLHSFAVMPHQICCHATSVLLSCHISFAVMSHQTLV